MPSQKNIQLLQEVKDRVSKSEAILFADYQKITHKTLEEARKSLRDLNAEISITKNNLMHLALQEKSIDAKEKLQGQLASFFAYGDPAAVAKAVFAFFKKNSDVKNIKFGVFEGKLIDDKQLQILSNLPSREVLLSKMVGSLKSPLSGLVYALAYNTQKLALVLKAIEEKKKTN